MKKFISIILSAAIILPCFALYSYCSEESVSDVLALENEEAFAEEPAILTVNTDMQVAVAAKSCVLMDANTGTVLMTMNENEQLYPASVTKIMTLLLVCEALDSGKITFETPVTCTENASSKGGSQIWLETGETMTVHELLKAACVYSANDACTALAETVAGSEDGFVKMMNDKAAELNMTNTHFDNCTGLDDDTDTHKTSALDIALMSRALLSHKYITDYTTIWMDSLRNGQTQLVNTNRLIRFFPGANGLKTGTTSKAGCCISASAERDSLCLIAVVLGAGNSNDRFDGAKALLNWGFANYEVYRPQIDSSVIGRVKVIHGTEMTVGVKYDEPSDILVNKGAAQSITQNVELCESIEAPVEAGQILGKITISSSDIKIAEYNLYADAVSEKMTFSKALRYIFTAMKK